MEKNNYQWPKVIVSLVLLHLLSFGIIEAQLVYPGGGVGSYTTYFDFDIYHVPSKIVGWCGNPVPSQPCSLDYKLNADGHYPYIATNRRKYQVTPKVTANFKQHFQSPEWWSTHIWNFATNTETRAIFNDVNAHGTAEPDLPKDFTAAYGQSTHPHPLVFNNRGYGFGLGQYGAATYSPPTQNEPNGPFPIDTICDGIGNCERTGGNENWTSVLLYDFGSDLNVSMGGNTRYDGSYYHVDATHWVPESTGTLVDKYGDWTATVIWPYENGDTLEVTAGKGVPYAQCRRSGNDTINISYNGTFNNWATNTNSIGLSIDRYNSGSYKHYGVFFPTGTIVEGLDPLGQKFFSYLFEMESAGFMDTVNTGSGTFARNGYDWQNRGFPDWDGDGKADSTARFSCFRIILPPGAQYFSIAALPNADPATLIEFQKRAFAYLTDSKVSYSYDMANATMNNTFTVYTQLVPDAPAGSMNETVQALYMHQYKFSTAGDPTMTYRSPRGPMRLHYGNSFQVKYTHIGLLPNLGWANTGDTAYMKETLDELKNQGSLFYDKNPNGWFGPPPYGFYGETYEHGTFLNKYADLLPISRQLEKMDVFNLLMDSIKADLEDWLDASDYCHNCDRYKFMLYDSIHSSIAGYPTGHYAACNFNDHQLHWGYFIKAAAMVARYDQAWAKKWGPMVEMLIRDANSWDRNDKLFGFMRYFDPYEGHSWISGRAEGRAGLDIESSSESINFATAVALWGANTNQPQIRDWGLFIATMEYKGVQYYWWNMDGDVHDPAYPDRVVSSIWGSSSNFETFFTTTPAGHFIINWLPITGASMYLGYNTPYMQTMWDEMEQKEQAATGLLWNWSDVGKNPYVFIPYRTKEWRSIMAMYRSFWDPAWAIDMEDELKLEFQGWERNDPAHYSYVKWDDWGAKYDVNTSWTGLHPTMIHHFIHTFDSVGVLDLTTADWAFTNVFVKDTCKHYMLYNPPGEPARTVKFSDGASFFLPADTLVVYRYCPTVMPVELLDFTAVKTGRDVKTSWTTESEVNSNYFIVERSSDGVHFTSIGKVKSVGSSKEIDSYSFTDEKPDNGKNYYRLKQVDLNGNYSYSKIVSVTFNEGTNISLYPNPTNGEVVVSIQNALGDYINISICDIVGREIFTKSIRLSDGYANENIDISFLPSATYLCKIFNIESGETNIVKLVKN